MRILTIIKQVPDSNAAIKVDAEQTGIERAGLKLICDPFDEFGVELAIQLREKRSDVEEVVVLCLGPDQAADAIRTALAMGADRAIHVTGSSAGNPDEVLAAAVLAAAIKKQNVSFDLIFCGKYNVDLDAGAVGPALAEFLGIAHVGAVQGLEVADDGSSFVARRRIEGAEEVVHGRTPALLTIEKGLVEPRYPSLPNLMKAKKKPVEKLTDGDLPDLNVAADSVVLKHVLPPPKRAACKVIEGEPEEMAKELVRLLREEAKVI